MDEHRGSLDDEHATVSRPGARRAIRLTLMAVTFGLAFLLTYVQMTRTQLLRESRVSLERYLDGTAHKPFVYRLLVPRVIYMLRTVVPDAVVRPIATSEIFEHIIYKSNDGTDPVVCFYLTTILVGSLMGYAIVGQRLWVSVYSRCRYPELVSIGLLTLVIPFVAQGVGHCYDFSVLFFMTMLLYLIATHRHALYLAFFAVSTLNKETTILASFAYAAYFAGRLPLRAFVSMMAAQATTFLLIYGGLKLHFAGNAGNTLEIWGREQFNWFFSLPFGDFAAYLGCMLLVAYRWPTKPLALKRSAWMIVPHVALFVHGGHPAEFRALYESVPLLSMFILHNILELVVGPGPGRPRDESADEDVRRLRDEAMISPHRRPSCQATI